MKRYFGFTDEIKSMNITSRSFSSVPLDNLQCDASFTKPHQIQLSAIYKKILLNFEMMKLFSKFETSQFLLIYLNVSSKFIIEILI